jgi:hypothetical protein
LEVKAQREVNQKVKLPLMERKRQVLLTIKLLMGRVELNSHKIRGRLRILDI